MVPIYAQTLHMRAGCLFIICLTKQEVVFLNNFIHVVSCCEFLRSFRLNFFSQHKSLPYGIKVFLQIRYQTHENLTKSRTFVLFWFYNPLSCVRALCALSFVKGMKFHLPAQQ